MSDRIPHPLQWGKSEAGMGNSDKSPLTRIFNYFVMLCAWLPSEVYLVQLFVQGDLLGLMPAFECQINHEACNRLQKASSYLLENSSKIICIKTQLMSHHGGFNCIKLKLDRTKWATTTNLENESALLVGLLIKI